MTKQEIREFIEKMEEIGDVWEEADAERVYGDMTLEAALDDRRSAVNKLFGIFGKVLNNRP